MNHRWTLVFDGTDKVYVLSEFRWTGKKWHRIATLHFTELNAALDQIRKGEAEKQ